MGGMKRSAEEPGETVTPSNARSKVLANAAPADRALAKIEADIVEGLDVLKRLTDTSLRSCGELQEALKSRVDALRVSFASLQDAKFSKNVAAWGVAWGGAKQNMIELSLDIAEGRGRLDKHHGVTKPKPYSTPHDDMLKANDISFQF